MSKFLDSKRIRILAESEIDDLFAIPKFNADERLFFFELNECEQSLLPTKKTLESKVDFIIQLGYFKAKSQFFTFTFNDVKDDESYVIERFYTGQIFQKTSLSYEQKRKNKHEILEHMGMCFFDQKIHVPLLLEKAKSISRISNDPVFIFRGLFDFLKEQKITLPAYTTFQEKIISVAIQNENDRLYKIINDAILEKEKKSLLTLLHEKDRFYTITSLKKNPKNFKFTAIKNACIDFENLLPLYQIASQILPLLNLSKTAIAYYASLVDHYTVQGLKNLNENQTCLWLLCFVFLRYRLMLDNLTTMFIYTSNKYKSAVDKMTDELLLLDFKKPSGDNSKIARALNFYCNPKVDATKAFSKIIKKVNKFFPHDKLIETVGKLKNKNSHSEKEAKLKWVAVDKLSRTYKTPLRLLMKLLTLNGDQNKDLQKAHQFLKTKLSSGTTLSKIKFDEFPLDFILSQSSFVYNKDSKTLNTNRYEYELYRRSAKCINQSELFVTNSTHYSSLKENLIENFDDKKFNIIKNLNNAFLNNDISHFIENNVKTIDEKIFLVNENIRSGANKFVKIKADKDDKEKSWTLPYTRKNKEINNPFYNELKNICITQVIKIVNEKTGFLNEFTHIKPHYSKSKKDEIAIGGVLIAKGTFLGISKMSEISDMSKSDLMTADQNYMRMSTLSAANDCLSNAISKLPIFKKWNLRDNFLLSSIDGQKMKVAFETLMSRNSLKYFGLEKGVVSYSLIANHVPINAMLIGANMHESHFLFDVFYNNSSLIKPDAISSDTEGCNQLNFLLLYIIEKIFMPRYRSLTAKTQSIISATSIGNFNNCLIKPNRVFNESLVREEADNIQHIIASLLSGEAEQHNIVRKLSSSHFMSKTKEALWEMNAALMTNHLLDYVDDLSYRQAIQGGLCRGEAYHQLKRAIEKTNGNCFSGTSDADLMISHECARLLTNCVIYYNALILNALKEQSDKNGDTELSNLIIRLSPAAWGHINFQGRYVFMDDAPVGNLQEMVKHLFAANNLH